MKKYILIFSWIINLSCNGQEFPNTKNGMKENSEDYEIEFSNLFNEGTTIEFSPTDLNKNTSEIKEFKSKLELYEKQHPLKEDFDPKNLQNLLNYDVFENAEWHVDSSWLKYFLNEYKIDVKNLENIFQMAIHQEDFNAIKLFIDKGYIVSNKDIELANEIKQESDEKISINKNYNGIDKYGEPVFYVDKYSKISEILISLKSKYLTNHIEDSDGYTNLRKEKNSSSEVLQKIKSGEHIEILDNSGDWWQVKTKEGKMGYVHKSRIKSGNSNSHSTSFLLYERPDFSSFSKEVLAKGDVEIIYQNSVWDFVKINDVII
jgi:hypothetical protein